MGLFLGDSTMASQVGNAAQSSFTVAASSRRAGERPSSDDNLTLQKVTQGFTGGGVPAPPTTPQLPAAAPVASPPAVVMHRLSVQQVRAVELIVGGSTDAAVARAVDVHRVTI